MNIKPLLLLGMFAVGCVVGAYQANILWKQKWQRTEAAALQNQLKAVNDAVAEYRVKLTAMEKTHNETKNLLNKVNSDSIDAIDANERLQQSYRDSLQRSSQCTDRTETTRHSAAEATDRHVQAVVFERISRRAIEYAKIADENRIRGLACEAHYNNIAKD